MAKKSEIIVIPIDASAAQGWNVFWAVSKAQVDIILHEITEVSLDNRSEFHMTSAEWQDKTLPVISLENYFGLSQSVSHSNGKYVVAKSVDSKGQVIRLMVYATGNIRLQSVDFSCFPATASVLPKRREDALGVYSLQGRNVLIVPDLVKIFESL